MCSFRFTTLMPSSVKHCYVEIVRLTGGPCGPRCPIGPGKPRLPYAWRRRIKNHVISRLIMWSQWQIMWSQWPIMWSQWPIMWTQWPIMWTQWPIMWSRWLVTHKCTFIPGNPGGPAAPGKPLGPWRAQSKTENSGPCLHAWVCASNHHAGRHTCEPFLPCFPGSPKGPCKNKQRPTSLLHSRLGTLTHH